MDNAKPFDISKRTVWDAWLKVKANQGGAGVDEESIRDFNKRLKLNLYKIWNRMSSGTYFPPPVRVVEIPKSGGGSRTLGIPTVGDRVAQTVLKLYLEPIVEPMFHDDSYGYRPRKSALDAVGMARKRCWHNDWVVDLDIKGFFDNIDHALMMRAMRKHTDNPWILLYVERWLKAPALLRDGTQVPRDKGTPQGGVASPLLANIFLHHVLDVWLSEQFPNSPFERYADDVIVHCRSETEAKGIQRSIEERLQACKLEAHPQKTKVVYCRDSNRTGSFRPIQFDFLGFTFRPREAVNRVGEHFVSFAPGVSAKSAKTIVTEIRRWQIHRKSDTDLEDIGRIYNRKIQGWINYYGTFYKSALYPVFRPLNRRLVRWVRNKYKRRHFHRKATKWLREIARKEPSLFAHWKMGVFP